MIRIRSAELMQKTDSPVSEGSDEAQRSSQNHSKQTTDYFTAFNYISRLDSMKKNISKITSIKRDLLSYLHEGSISLSEIFKYSKSFCSIKDLIDKQLDDVNRYTKSRFININILQAYYTRYVLQDIPRAMKLLKQSINRKSNYDVNMILNLTAFKQTSVTIVQASIELNDCHKITYATDNLVSTLGYSSSEIIGQSINSLMPACYRRMHSLVAHPLLMQYNTINNHEKTPLRLAIHITRKLVPCQITLKLNPLNSIGIHIAANMIFNKKSKQESFILLDDKNKILSTDESLKT